MGGRFDPYDSRHVQVKDTPLERSYEASKRQFWNDTEVMDALIAKHGSPRLSFDERVSLAAVLSPIYHGEIVALHVSADLVGLVDDLGAKKVLAAQVIEEAKHVSALSRYIREAGLVLVPVDPWARRLLDGIRNCQDPVLKLLGMQLLTENVAHAIFRTLCDSIEDPVLKGLLEYIDRDEVKHVGLARNYLPKLLRQMKLRKLPSAWAVQSWWNLCLLTSTWLNRDHAERLGVDMNLEAKRQSRDLTRMIRGLGDWRERLPVAVLPQPWNERLIDWLYPPRAKRSHSRAA